MDSLVMALGPAFAAGFAVQRLLEILDPIVSGIVSQANKGAGFKAGLLGVISFFVGLWLAWGVHLSVLSPLGVKAPPLNGLTDLIVTALVVSAGTEGFNSIMKFLGYSKENAKKELAGGSAQPT